jgi:hypothetical protein
MEFEFRDLSSHECVKVSLVHELSAPAVRDGMRFQRQKPGRCRECRPRELIAVSCRNMANTKWI